MNVLIDPYMFELSSEQDICNNLSFFMEIIKLSQSLNGFSITVYKGMIDRMQKRAIQPFPIKLDEIRDQELKNTILQINNSFANALIRTIESIDIDGCSGNQEFMVDGQEVDDEHYFELYSVLLIPCYSQNIYIDKRIITGNKIKGKQIGDSFKLECGCKEHDYLQEYQFVGVGDLISAKDKVIRILKEKRKNGEIPIVDRVQAGMGDHHNHVQANGKKFDWLDELSTQNKSVLCLLQELGLFKIIFERFTSMGIRVTGTMSIRNVEEKEQQDIVSVKFSAETGMLIITSLYFPKGIGKVLHNYYSSEQLTYKNVSELIEKIQ